MSKINAADDIFDADYSSRAKMLKKSAASSKSRVSRIGVQKNEGQSTGRGNDWTENHEDSGVFDTSKGLMLQESAPIFVDNHPSLDARLTFDRLKPDFELEN